MPSVQEPIRQADRPAAANHPPALERPGALDAARAFGVTFGASIALDAAATAAAVSAGRALVARRRPRGLSLAGVAATVAYVVFARPRMEAWGMRPGEGRGHAVEIDAPPAEVWPWLAQIGQDRGGFYSYEWLENLAGCRMHNAREIHPEWQHREPGEQVMLHWGHGLPVTRFEQGHAIGLQGWGSFELEALPGGRTRLTCRGENPRGGARVFYELLVQIPHFLMERKMLLTIKRRAEEAAHPETAGARGYEAAGP
jgi:hypothetical protein